jgi:hypothetical protein
MSEMSHVERMTDRESMDAIVADFLERALDEDPEVMVSTPEFKEQVREFTKIGYDNALAIIFEHAESEIEKIFLNSVVLGFLRMDPLGFMMLGPSQNAPAYIKNLQQAHRAVSKLRGNLAKEGKGRTVAQYIDWLEREREIVDQEELGAVADPRRNRSAD